MRSKLLYKGILRYLLSLEAMAFMEGRSLFINMKYFLPDANTFDNNLKLYSKIKEAVANKGGNHTTNESSRTNHTILDYDFKPVYVVISIQKLNTYLKAESYNRIGIHTYNQLKLNVNKSQATFSFINKTESCNAYRNKTVSQFFNYKTHQEIQFSSFQLDKNKITKVKTYNSND